MRAMVEHAIGVQQPLQQRMPHLDRGDQIVLRQEPVPGTVTVHPESPQCVGNRARALAASVRPIRLGETCALRESRRQFFKRLRISAGEQRAGADQQPQRVRVQRPFGHTVQLGCLDHRQMPLRCATRRHQVVADLTQRQHFERIPSVTRVHRPQVLEIRLHAAPVREHDAVDVSLTLGKTPVTTVTSPPAAITSSPTRTSPIRMKPVGVSTSESSGCALPEPTSPATTGSSARWTRDPPRSAHRPRPGRWSA